MVDAYWIGNSLSDAVDPVLMTRSIDSRFRAQLLPEAWKWLKGKPEAGLAQWPELDADVWGGSYSGHTKNGTTYSLVLSPGGKGHPILQNVDLSNINGHLSLYLTAPLTETTTCLLQGKSEKEDSLPPVAWTNQRSNGGLSFYTSLGHVDDFAQDDFQQMLRNAAIWLIEKHQTK